jgi:parvulin-like peptidyl-prolyl isomerase
MKIVKKYNSFLILFILLVISSINNCSKEDVLVARVGSKPITLRKFEDEFAKGKNAEAIKKSSLEDKKNFLDGMIDKQLKIIDAYQNHLDTSKKIIDQVDSRSLGFMFNRLIEREVIQKIIPESEIRDYYEKANKEVKIKQILIKFDPDNPEQKQQSFNRAKKIAQRLKNQENFEKLATEISDDINTAKKGGDKGFLKWGATSVENPVYVAAFSMKTYEISDPIETPNGYYIIKVVDIKKYDGSSFEQQRDTIRRQLYSAKNKKIEQGYYDYLDKLRKKYQAAFSDESIEIFTQKFLSPDKDPLNNNTDSLQKFIDPLENFTDNENKLAIVGFRNGNLTIGDLVEELKRYPPRRRPNFRNKEDVQNFINYRLVPVYLLEQEVKDQNIKNDKFVKEQVKSLRENMMLNEIQQIQVNDKISVKDEDVQNYFEQHREDYKNPEKREIQQLYVNDKELADDLVKRARRGADFTRLFRRYNQNKSIKGNDGKLEITENRPGIGKPSFKIKKDEVTDPIKIGDGYYIVKVLNIIEPALKTLEESKNIVASKVRQVARENREKEWIEQLHNRINYVVYEGNLAKTFTNYSGKQNMAHE